MHMEYEVRSMKYKACSRDMHVEWSPNSSWNVARDIFCNASTWLQDDTWMMAKLSIRISDIICLTSRWIYNRVSFSSALSESRRLFLRSLSLVDRRAATIFRRLRRLCVLALHKMSLATFHIELGLHSMCLSRLHALYFMLRTSYSMCMYLR